MNVTVNITTASVTLTLIAFDQFKTLAQIHKKSFIIDDVTPFGVTITSEKDFLDDMGYTNLVV